MTSTVSSIMPVYRRADITMARGEGVYLEDDTGKRYLDFASGIAVNALGHGHPHLVEALKKQVDTLWHCSNNYHNDELTRFADRLMAQSPLSSVFFSCSGAEAVESGMKFIRRYHYATGHPKRNRIITFENAFHGRSMACISAGKNELAREGFAPLLDGFDQVPFNDLDAVKAAITDETAGILVEPIQGEGGINVADKAFLQGLRNLCDEHGLILMLDEVQCGYGRSGQLFTHTLFDIVPDIVCCAKGIGNGFPLGATLVSKAVEEAMTPGCHGSTYGSNPLAMAVGNAVLDVMLEDGFFKHVRDMGEMLLAAFKQLAADMPDMIRNVRGQGLILGVELAIPARPFAGRLREAGLLVAPATNNVLRLTPPLIIEKKHVDEAMTIMRDVMKEQG